MPTDRRPNDSQDNDLHDLLVERLRLEPAPPMHLDLGEVVAQGRRRTRQRAARLAVAACAAAVAAVAVGSTLISAHGNDSTTPAGTSSTAPRQTSGVASGPASVDQGLSGRHTLTVGDAAYTMSAGDGLLTVDVIRGGDRQRHVAGLVSGSAAWRVVDGTNGRPVVVGIVPGVAGAIELRPVAGQTVPKHTVSLSPGRDFTAFVVTFAEPLDTATPAADIGWSAGGPVTSWILGTEPQMVGLAVTMAGEGKAPLAPYDLTRTGPPTTSGTSGTSSVVISVDMPDSRIGTTAVATLEGNLVVKDPAGLTAQLMGADPETSLARGVFELTDGRTFAWGVAPAESEGAVPHLDGGARAGVAVLGPMLGQWTAYAVQVEGSSAQVSGMKIPLGPRRGSLEVIE